MKETLAVFVFIGTMGFIPQPEEAPPVEILLLFAVPQCGQDFPAPEKQHKPVWL